MKNLENQGEEKKLTPEVPENQETKTENQEISPEEQAKSQIDELIKSNRQIQQYLNEEFGPKDQKSMQGVKLPIDKIRKQLKEIAQSSDLKMGDIELEKVFKQQLLEQIKSNLDSTPATKIKADQLAEAEFNADWTRSEEDAFLDRHKEALERVPEAQKINLLVFKNKDSIDPAKTDLWTAQFNDISQKGITFGESPNGLSFSKMQLEGQMDAKALEELDAAIEENETALAELVKEKEEVGKSKDGFWGKLLGKQKKFEALGAQEEKLNQEKEQLMAQKKAAQEEAMQLKELSKILKKAEEIDQVLDENQKSGEKRKGLQQLLGDPNQITVQKLLDSMATVVKEAEKKAKISPEDENKSKRAKYLKEAAQAARDHYASLS